MVALPDRSFSEIARELGNLAWREAAGAEQIALLAARQPGAMLIRSADEAKISAALIGELSRLFADLAPDEAKARRALSTIEAGRRRVTA